MFARRIVAGKIELDERDKQEFELIIGGAVLAVRLAGIVTSALGFLFLMIVR